MTARAAGEAAAFSRIAHFLGSEFVKASGDAEELKASLQASEAKAAALQAELDEMKKAADPKPEAPMDDPVRQANMAMMGLGVDQGVLRSVARQLCDPPAP